MEFLIFAQVIILFDNVQEVNAEDSIANQHIYHLLDWVCILIVLNFLFFVFSCKINLLKEIKIMNKYWLNNATDEVTVGGVN